MCAASPPLLYRLVTKAEWAAVEAQFAAGSTTAGSPEVADSDSDGEFQDAQEEENPDPAPSGAESAPAGFGGSAVRCSIGHTLATPTHSRSCGAIT